MLLDEAIAAARSLYEIYESPEAIEPLYQHLRTSLITMHEEMEDVMGH